METTTTETVTTEETPPVVQTVIVETPQEEEEGEPSLTEQLGLRIGEFQAQISQLTEGLTELRIWIGERMAALESAILALAQVEEEEVKEQENREPEEPLPEEPVPAIVEKPNWLKRTLLG